MGLEADILSLIVALVIAAQPPIVSPSGLYTVITPGPTVVTYTDTSVTFSWADPSPNPSPNPVPPVPVPVPPAPSPVPVPVLTGRVWALAIYDPVVVLPAAQQAALWSPTLAKASLTQDVSFQAHSSKNSAVATWVPLITGKLPVLIFVQQDAAGKGTLEYQVPLPGTEAEILAVVNKIRGK